MEMLFLSDDVEAARQSLVMKDLWMISVAGRRYFNFILFFNNVTEQVPDLIRCTIKR